MFAFPADTVLLFLAASLAKPLQPVLDSYTARTNTVILRESGASLEHVRKVTELHRIPDLLLLADADVFPRFLVPAYAASYSEFARNRIVLAYTDRSRYAKDINASNWTKVITRGGLEIGRTDPNLAPVGYRTLLTLQLAERHYRIPGLAKSILNRAPDRNMRGNAAELAALLASGELDYIFDYQSVAESNGFRFLQLPPEIDLGDPKRAALYASESVTVRGSTPGARATFAGQPIVYGAAIPTGARHRLAAEKLYQYLTSPATIATLREAHVDMLDTPVVRKGQSKR